MVLHHSAHTTHTSRHLCLQADRRETALPKEAAMASSPGLMAILDQLGGEEMLENLSPEKLQKFMLAAMTMAQSGAHRDAESDEPNDSCDGH